MAVSDYKTNPDENTTISGINIAEGCPPSGINNAIRQLMADVKKNSDDQDKSIQKAATTIMTGATASAAGTSGNVPAPQAGDQNKPLTGGGKYADSLDCNITGSSGSCTGNAATATKLQGGTGNLAMPVGAIYVQFSGQSAPADLFGGTWSNVSASYAGRFFRAEGGSAAEFEKSQAGGIPNLSGYVGNIDSWVMQGTPSGAFYRRDGGRPHGVGDGGNSDNWYNINFQASRSNSLYGAASEVRPINSTIRIWKRTK